MENTLTKMKPVYKAVTNDRDIDLIELDQFVKNHPTGNFFQSLEYYEFYKSLRDYDTLLVCAVNDRNRIVGSVICVINWLLPSFKFKLLSRGIVFGGPLISEDVDNKGELMHLLIEELNKLVNKKSVYLEFRNLFDVSHYRSIYEKNGYIFHDHLNFIIDSSNHENVISRISKTKLRQVRKSMDEGAEISIATKKEEVKQFYQLVVNLYTKKVKKPFPKWEFFEKFFDQREKLGHYIIVKYNGKVIAGMMCPVFENKIIYDWYVSGEDRAYKNIYPSVLVTFGAIDYAVKNNFASYDFLGAGKPKQEYGVREFKAQFGGDLINNGRYAKILNKRKFDLSQWILKRLGYFK